MTIADNIRFGKPAATIEDVISAAAVAGLDEDILTFPQGYDTILGERGITLSGGQKQRLAIARAILKDPLVLVLDDALSAVDSATEEKVLANLRRFMKNRTTIIISHRISTVRESDNIITLDRGSIVESGTHGELVRLKGRYAEMFHRQQLEQEIEQMQ
jgi:ATP-binding cassette subfamily B protein